MWIRRVGVLLLAGLVGGLGGGCKKSPPPAVPLLKPPVETVARVHWLGKQRLAGETNAASFVDLWNLPESKNLEMQTLDRLAVGLLGGNHGAGSSNKLSVIGAPGAGITNRSSVTSNAMSAAQSRSTGTNKQPAVTYQPAALTGSAALLRPLLEDLLQHESFTQVRQATNEPGELTLVIKLPEERGRLWQTNLAALLESLTASRTADIPGRTNGWQLQFQDHRRSITRTFDLARVGEWTVLGLAPGRNELFGEALTLFGENPNGDPLAPKDMWLLADLDVRRVASAMALNWDLPADLPKLSFGVTADGQTVRTRAQLNFAKPLPFELEPWNIPTNLIHDPLVSFTAVQGLRPWLSASKLWQGLDLGAAPNQLYVWGQWGPQFLSYFAAPMTNARSVVERATERLLQKPNDYLTTEGLGKFERSTNGPGVLWSGVLLMAPYLQPVTLSGGDFVFGGLAINPTTNQPPSADLLKTILGDTSLVAYQWELTGTRLDEWLHFGQLARFALHLAQVPPPSVSMAWLMALEPKLGNCVTGIRRTGPAQLSFTRRSALGLSAAELDFLADWLESPQFPHGLNTFLGEPSTLPRRRPPGIAGQTRTNSVSPGPPAPPARPAPHP